MRIPTLHRPLYDGCRTPEEKAAAMTKAMGELQTVNDKDGMDFNAKTAMGIAYERFVESQRNDSLFVDPLASEMFPPYGQIMSDALAFGLTYSVFDPPGANINLGLEGHVLYTAARTKLINDHVEGWLNNTNNNKDEKEGPNDTNNNNATPKQVLNLGSGLDTRAYWLDCLKTASCYWEIDQPSVHTHREAVLETLARAKQLPLTKCPRRPVAMDFCKESLREQLMQKNNGWNTSIPTCWIVEGLIMYLSRAETEQLLQDIGHLSAPGSYLILNFSTNDTAPGINEIQSLLLQKDWTLATRLLFFGQENFNFGRYPSDKPANTVLGFAMFQKEKREE